jgi:hypothetical protein
MQVDSSQTLEQSSGMQSTGVDVELQRTLDELCSDLLATSALDDCNAILQSLALLAETFAQARSQLGRLLSRSESRCVKLAALATRFLYKKETARSAVCLLAALASDNVRNQTRILQHVTGVQLVVDLSRYSRDRGSTLYALTVPAAVTSTYRRWRKRQRELQSGRLPSGAPPARGGVPMPCYCDACLGAQQFLSTWQQHFHDLARWCRDPDKETLRASNNPRQTLSTEEFFRVFLADYQLQACSVEGVLAKRQEAGGSYAGRARSHPSLVYFFVSPEEATAATPRTPVRFDPLRHLSAIAIAPEVDIAVAPLQALQRGPKPSAPAPEPPTLATDRVILFTSESKLEPCAVLPSACPDSSAGDDAAFSSPEAPQGQLAHCDSLAIETRCRDCEIAQTTRELLLEMLALCEGGDPIPLRRVDEKQQDAAALRSPAINANVTMTAKLSEQVLQIDCTYSSSPRSHSTRVPQSELVGAGSTADQSRLGLLCLSDAALEGLLRRCRICTCDGNQDNHAEGGSAIHLRPVDPEDEERVLAPDISEQAVETEAPGTGALPVGAVVRLPLPGLSSETTQELLQLEAVVSEDRYRRLTLESLTTITEKLAKVVAGCNERISYLSIARDRGLVRASTEVHRAAAISRCRHCRDLLILLGKKLSLKLKPLDASAPVPLAKLSRMATLVRTSIRDILGHSEGFDPWETPDARVDKLQLDPRRWASGFPDPAYYQDTDTRRRENRKKQQQLSQQLLRQQQQKRPKPRR